MTPRPAASQRTAVWLLASGRLISLTGGAAAYTALNFYLYERTGSAVWVAAALFLTFGTIGFASPLAGWVGDRFDRRRVMIVSDLAGAGGFGVMALVDDPGVLLVFAFLSALAEAPFLSASAAAIPNLVPEDDLSWANGLVTVGRQAGILLGPVLGGTLVAGAGPELVFVLNAVSFVISAVMIAGLRGLRFGGSRADAERQSGVIAGLSFVARDRVLRTMVFGWLALVLALGMSMVADVPLVELFGAGSFGYGLLIASWGAGSVVGSLAAGRWFSARTEPFGLVAGIGIVALSAGIVWIAPWFQLVLVAIVVMGIGDGLSMVAHQGIVQRRAPDAVRARVMGAMDAVIHVGLGLSYLVAGPAVDALGPRGVYGVGGLGTVIGVLILLPILREARAVAVEAGPAPAGAGRPVPAPTLLGDVDQPAEEIDATASTS
jgi:MFS family permease